MNPRLGSEHRKDALERGIELHELLCVVSKSLWNLHLELLPLESKERIDCPVPRLSPEAIVTIIRVPNCSTKSKSAAARNAI